MNVYLGKSCKKFHSPKIKIPLSFYPLLIQWFAKNHINTVFNNSGRTCMRTFAF